MIDPRAARNDPDEFRRKLARKGAGEAFDAWLAADERWRELVPRVDELRAKTKLKGKPTPEQLEEMRGVKEELQAAEQELTAAEEARDAASFRIPNPPADDVPDGGEDDARVERIVGEPPQLEEPRESLEIGRFDMDRAARMSGARFGYWIGGTAQLALAMYRLALDRIAAKGFLTVLPPVLVREEALYGTGHFPSDADSVYAVPADGLYLSGTAEIPLSSLHAGEILDADELPLRYVAFSPCFRREAGAAGKDTRGMFRVHQFNKVEQFSLTTPESSWDEHELLLANTEELVQELGMPYRIVTLAAGDISAAAAKTYDVEIWFPSQERTARPRRSRTRPTSRPVGSGSATATARTWSRCTCSTGRPSSTEWHSPSSRTSAATCRVLREYGAPERVTP